MFGRYHKSTVSLSNLIAGYRSTSWKSSKQKYKQKEIMNKLLYNNTGVRVLILQRLNVYIDNRTLQRAPIEWYLR